MADHAIQGVDQRVSIELDRLSFSYGGADGGPGEAGKGAGLDELTLTAPAGQVTAVLGPSGAGKSTLLGLVAGLLAPDRGDVRFDGRSVVHLPPEKRDLGVVFQSYALFAHMTVEDNVGFGLTVRGVGRRAARRRVAALLERFEIAPLARRYPVQLSGGERQRVALARALAAAPRALLLDEPLAALDARLRLALRAELAERLAETGVTTLYVTHDQEEAMALGDRVAVLRDGRLEQVGSPEELYRRPATPFVASFVGEANFLPVVWDAALGVLSGPLGVWSLKGSAGGPTREALARGTGLRRTPRSPDGPARGPRPGARRARPPGRQGHRLDLPGRAPAAGGPRPAPRPRHRAARADRAESPRGRPRPDLQVDLPGSEAVAVGATWRWRSIWPRPSCCPATGAQRTPPDPAREPGGHPRLRDPVSHPEDEPFALQHGRTSE